MTKNQTIYSIYCYTELIDGSEMNNEGHNNPHYHARRGRNTPTTSPLIRAVDLEQQQALEMQQQNHHHPLSAAENAPQGVTLPPILNLPLVAGSGTPPHGTGVVVETGDSGSDSDFSQSPPTAEDPSFFGRLQGFNFPPDNSWPSP